MYRGFPTSCSLSKRVKVRSFPRNLQGLFQSDDPADVIYMVAGAHALIGDSAVRLHRHTIILQPILERSRRGTRNIARRERSNPLVAGLLLATIITDIPIPHYRDSASIIPSRILSINPASPFSASSSVSIPLKIIESAFPFVSRRTWLSRLTAYMTGWNQRS